MRAGCAADCPPWTPSSPKTRRPCSASVCLDRPPASRSRRCCANCSPRSPRRAVPTTPSRPRSTTSWPRWTRAPGAPGSNGWSPRRRRSCSARPLRGASGPTVPSATSASPPSLWWNSATGSPHAPACGCPPPSPSTTPPRVPWPGTCTPRCSVAPSRPRRPSRPPNPTTPWRSSAWPAACPAASTAPTSCGGWSASGATLSPRSPPTAAGTPKACSTRIPAASAPPTSTRAASCPTRGSSTRASSGSRQGRHWPWIPSSACCWRPRGRRWSTPASMRRP